MSMKLPPFPNDMMILVSCDRETSKGNMHLTNECICTNWELLRQSIWNRIYENAYKVYFDLNSVKTNTTFIQLTDCNDDRIEWLNTIMRYIAESMVIDVSRSSYRQGYKFTSFLKIFYQYDDTFPKYRIPIPVQEFVFSVYFKQYDNVWKDSSLLQPESQEEYSLEEWQEEIRKKEISRMQYDYSTDDE